jgi:hypothetical protein
LVLAAGIALRILHYLQQRTLWLDEARLALNIASRSFPRLALPLDYDQSAPLLFLWAAKLATVVAGLSELSLRFVPLVASIGALLLMYPVAVRFLSPSGALWATAFLAFAPMQVYYANELKQYSLELLVTVALTLAALRWSEGPTPPRRRWLTALVLLSPWASAPSVFIVLPLLVGLLLTPSARRRDSAGIAGLGMGWLASSVFAYVVLYQAASRNPYLHHFWEPAFLRPGQFPFFHTTALSLREMFWGLFAGHPLTTAMRVYEQVTTSVGAAGFVVLIAIGVLVVIRTRDWPAAAVLAGPLVALLAASVLEIYPFALRLVLFAAPSLYILAVTGLESLLAPVSARRRRLATRAAAGLTLLVPIYLSLEDAVSGNYVQQIRSLVAEYQRMGAPEPIYVYAGSIPAWVFYTTDWSSPDRARLRFAARVAGVGGPSFENMPSRRGPVPPAPPELTTEYRGRLELLGTGTGMEAFPIVGPPHSRTDRGWAEVEARRIRSVARPDVWIIMSHYYLPTTKVLYELFLMGGRLTFFESHRDAMLLRFEFPGGAATSTSR